jgi:hypothetical protein
MISKSVILISRSSWPMIFVFTFVVRRGLVNGHCRILDRVVGFRLSPRVAKTQKLGSPQQIPESDPAPENTPVPFLNGTPESFPRPVAAVGARRSQSPNVADDVARLKGG